MKSILIVTEQFTLGGLETHIQGEIRQLAEHGITVHLACGSLFDDAFLPSSICTVYSGIPLGASASAGDLLTAINKLRAIIREQEIGAVHVHPFTSIIPAVAAAELEGVPYAITLHGPASLASYGPAYDLLFKEIILSNAPLIIAVSPEVQNMILPHTECEAVTYIPNSVSFSEAPPPFLDRDDNDPRWLVVSRLDAFKIQGILDFCIKAHLVGIPGVLIVGDGPAKEDLSQALAIRDLSDFAELAGARIDVPELMRRSSGVAGMGRVVLEGAAAKKSTVLVGYDGVKGVVDARMLKNAARNNFSGRGLPTLDLACFAKQIHTKATSEIISENYFMARESFSEVKSWRFFIQLLSGVRRTKPTLITALYYSLSETVSRDDISYLHSLDIFDNLSALACSKKYYDERLFSIIDLHRQRLEKTRDDQVRPAYDGQIASLNQAVSERDGQIASLNQAVAERDGQIASLNHMLAYARLNLQLLEQSWSWKITEPLRFARKLFNKVNWCISRFESVRRNTSLIAAFRRAIRFSQRRMSSPVRRDLRLHAIDEPIYSMPAQKPFGCSQAQPGRGAPPVLMLVDSFHDGGVERVVIDLCLQLRSFGRQCKVLVANDGGRSANEARLHGIEVVEFFKNSSLINKFISANKEGIVVAHHCYFALNDFHEANLPIVEVIHNAYHWQKGDQEIYKYRNQIISRFITVSEFVKTFSIGELDIDPSKVILINNGLSNVDLIRPPVDVLRQRRLQTIGDPILLHVANLHPQKNHRLIVNAFAHVKRAYPNARLIMAGAMDFYPELHKSLLADIKSLGLGSSIQLVGALDRRELSKTMAAAHIGLLPSMLEGFSIASLEFSFFGLPSVLSATGAADKLQRSYGHIEIAHGCALHQSQLSANAIESLLKAFPDETVLSLSNAILQILAGYPAYLERSFVAGEGFPDYSIEHTATQYDHLLKSLERTKAYHEATN